MHNYFDFIGCNIQQARSDAGMTQEQLVRELDISTSVISRLETGRTMFSVARLMEIAEVLGVFAGDLLRAPDI